MAELASGECIECDVTAWERAEEVRPDLSA
jgi:hypothetical protein